MYINNDSQRACAREDLETKIFIKKTGKAKCLAGQKGLKAKEATPRLQKPLPFIRSYV